jgi:ABC-type transport system involved in multi-copper enzyme maturation permease subunit
MNPLLVLDVVRFELRRSWTLGRGAIWITLVVFPIALVSALRVLTSVDRTEQWGIMLYFLIPEVICLLGLLLWATPAISTEVEGQTWIYLAMRRSGRTMVLLGKYMTAVLWTLSAAILSTTVCVIVMGPAGGFRLWSVMCLLSVLSCFAHASLYVAIGTIFFRRTMVTAVFYTLVIEYGLSFVPAVANKLTINYRLRGLLADWMNWDEARSAAENVFGNEPASTHLLVLAALTLTLLGVAMYRVGHTEFPTQQEG